MVRVGFTLFQRDEERFQLDDVVAHGKEFRPNVNLTSKWTNIPMSTLAIDLVVTVNGANI